VPVLAIEKRHGLISRIMLGKAGWDADGPAGSRVMRLGWFGTIPPSCSPRSPAPREPAC
jgi:hypothetical protein